VKMISIHESIHMRPHLRRNSKMWRTLRNIRILYALKKSRFSCPWLLCS